MKIQINKKTFCTKNKELTNILDIEECKECQYLHLKDIDTKKSCETLLHTSRLRRSYKRVGEFDGYPENHHQILSDEDIETMVIGYLDEVWIDILADKLKRTVGSVGWVWDILEKIKANNCDVEYFGSKRVEQVKESLLRNE